MKIWNFIKKAVRSNVSLVGLFIMLVLASCINQNFLSMENLSNVFRQISLTGPIAVGMLFVILCGSIDLSVGSVFALGAVVTLYFSKYSVAMAIAMPLLCGAFFGFINGLLVGCMKMPPFVGTISTQMFIRGLVLVLIGENTYSVGKLPGSLQVLGKGEFFSFITVPAIIFVVLLAAGSFLLNRTRIGRNMYVVGGNPESATMMGISVPATLITAYTLSGMLAAFSGMIVVTRIGSAYPLTGQGNELAAIAGAVIGGAYLSGGVGKVSGTFIGVTIMGLFTNVFNMQSFLSSFWERVFTGAILIAVVFVQAVITHQKTTGKKKRKILTAS
ncbi:ABC transporter permease [Lacrimispora sp. NSJ-141]|uniref:ABC transporter permease n=1 Tax=Lientehia hominis TaxID=2897778 RepID=A0AAP2RJF6_9FIRM|nr:ABC transporter permease [Lientehia hominis]MCD2493364.1 ABC transporter permease [Lientehia hominis]